MRLRRSASYGVRLNALTVVAESGRFLRRSERDRSSSQLHPMWPAVHSPRHASRSGGGSAVRYPKGRSSALRLTGEYPEPPSPRPELPADEARRLNPLFDRGDHAFVPPSAAVYFRGSYSRSVTVHTPLSACKTLLSMRYSDCKQFA